MHNVSTEIYIGKFNNWLHQYDIPVKTSQRYFKMQIEQTSKFSPTVNSLGCV